MFWWLIKKIDAWSWKGNILRDDEQMRWAALGLAFVGGIFWVLLGFDSGVKIIEDAIVNLPLLFQGNMNLQEWVSIAYQTYGCSFHFSSYLIYAVLYYGLSLQLRKVRICHAKNVFYSVMLVLFNIGIFELWYMATFAHFQMNRSILVWFVQDFFAPPVVLNFLFVVLGAFTLLALWVDSEELGFGYEHSMVSVLSVWLCIGSIILWVYYPFEVVPISYGPWTSNTLFPQTNYAYVGPDLYMPNPILHGVNLLTKSLFAFTLYMLLRRLSK